MRFAILVLTGLVLAGCGVNGAPVRPTVGSDTSAPNLTISGEINVGVVIDD
ncbi:MAG: hypothetical protein ABJP33_13360 [Pseudoruegeria sp.]